MSLEPAVVVGTGPSGVAIAAALMEAGVRPVMLDGGNLPDESAFAGQARSRSSDGNNPLGSSRAGTPRKEDPGGKAWFGSSSPFIQPSESRVDYQPDLVARASYGVGGLSRVWGGTFEFYRSFARWPSAARPSQSDFDCVRRIVPSSLTTWPEAGAGTSPGEVQGSPVSRRAMEAFLRQSRSGGWDVVPSVIAIDSRRGSDSACQPCGLCLTGCPLDSIWFAGDQIQRWAESGRIDYRPNHVVGKVEERPDRVTLRGQSAEQGFAISAERVFVAAGALSTAALLVESGFVDAVTVRDTATSFGAALDLRRRLKPVAAHGLSQWWVRTKDEDFSAQVYPPDASNSAVLADRLPMVPSSWPPASRLATRLHPVISYLHESLSDTLTVARSGSRISVMGSLSVETAGAFRDSLRGFARSLRSAGYWMPVRATQFTAPGTGYHFGASLRHGIESDDLGRPFGLSRLHIVDSSVLPALEVGSITPTVMANAIRIGRAVTQMDS